MSDDPTDRTADTRDPAALYREVAPAVLGYLRAHGAADPEDLLMDVFVAVVRDLHRVEGDDAAVRRWVFTIAHHRLVDERRRNGRRRRMGDDEARRHLEPTVDDPAGASPDPDLVAALATLPQAQRDVVVLRVVADLSVHDVARILRKRPGAVKTAQHRALARLAETLVRPPTG